ncbi:MAG: acyl-CoA dehydratase activase, partial [Limnochordia bacterium]
MRGYLGIDVGSVSTNLVVVDEEFQVIESLYLRTQGKPIEAIQKGLRELAKRLGDTEIMGVGTTGSGRQLAGVMVDADVVKNEITAHAVAASIAVPDVKTVLEIGGQDSKIIILREGVVVDFAMNTVCAAGTGSFLDQQAARLDVPIEDFGELALEATNPVRIAGRCTVFAESDMIHKQQMGHQVPDIVAGLCEAMVRNYLNNVGKGKEILAPVVFQGGVAANVGIKAAFSQA